MFEIGGTTLTLDNNITLNGHITNNMPLVRLIAGGNFVMNNGSIIQGNRAGDGNNAGGAVRMHAGTFTMNGGTIRMNTATSGGGVFIGNGTFNMHGGSISQNTTINPNVYTNELGGGVFVGGTFNLYGGTIAENMAHAGGGVYVSGGHLNIRGNALIMGNAAATRGGGVYVDNSANFTMSNGVVVGNNPLASETANNANLDGSALHIGNGANASFGPANGSNWQSFTTRVINISVEVINGVFVRPIGGLSLELDFLLDDPIGLPPEDELEVETEVITEEEDDDEDDEDDDD